MADGYHTGQCRSAGSKELYSSPALYRREPAFRNTVYFQSGSDITFPLLYVASSYVVAIPVPVGNRGSQTVFTH